MAAIHTLGDLKTMFVLYAIAFGTLSLCLAALNQAALLATVTPPLEPAEREMARAEIIRWCYAAVVAGASMAFALLLPANPPSWLTGMPGMVYGLRGFTGSVIARFNSPTRSL